MFESLTERLQQAFSPLRKKGRLSENDVRAALRDVRMALLEADVNFRVVRKFVAEVEPEAIGSEVLESLTPAQAVIRVVRDHLVLLLGGEAPIHLSSEPPTVILLVGLQGAGKTTAAAKLARWFHRQGRHPLLVAADIYRPAAVEQLRQLGEQAGVPVFFEADRRPEELFRLALGRARQLAADIVIVDTAGRLHVDEELMGELERIVAVHKPDEALLVVDAMTGQDAVTVAESFSSRLALSGLVMTKLDGDARGGAALSIRQVTGLPIKMVGVSEKLDGLEPFQPDRMAGRILGMGDVLGLIERAEASMDASVGSDLGARLNRNEFTLDDYLTALRQVKKMGPLSQLMDLIPGMGGQMKKLKGQVDDHALVRVEAVLSSMTLRERRRPQIIDGSRRRRIARGSGTTVQDVNRVLKSYEDMRKLARQMRGGKRGQRMPPGMPGLPPDFLPPPR
jgi:signal recognition particle subunit SRP54